MEEKQKIRAYRIIFSILIIAAVIITICLIANLDKIDSVLWLYVLYVVDVTILLLWINSLLLSSKMYRYQGKTITVYAGWYHRYIDVDGQIVDEHNTLITFSAIYLSGILSKDVTLEAVITLTNRITLKINGVLCAPMQ